MGGLGKIRKFAVSYLRKYSVNAKIGTLANNDI